jgi:hypothetical protein
VLHADGCHPNVVQLNRLTVPKTEMDLRPGLVGEIGDDIQNTPGFLSGKNRNARQELPQQAAVVIVVVAEEYPVESGLPRGQSIQLKGVLCFRTVQRRQVGPRVKE